MMQGWVNGHQRFAGEAMDGTGAARHDGGEDAFGP